MVELGSAQMAALAHGLPVVEQTVDAFAVGRDPLFTNVVDGSYLTNRHCNTVLDFTEPRLGWSGSVEERQNMKSIVAKRGPLATSASNTGAGPRRASRDADGELAHLEKVVGAVRASAAHQLPIASAYWMTRIHHLRVHYILLPVQLARLSAIERCIKDCARERTVAAPIRQRRVARAA